MDHLPRPGRGRRHRKRRFHVPAQARGIDYERFDVSLPSAERSLVVAPVAAQAELATPSPEEPPLSVEEEATAEISKERRLWRSRTLKLLGILLLILVCVRFDLLFRAYMAVVRCWYIFTLGH